MTQSKFFMRPTCAGMTQRCLDAGADCSPFPLRYSALAARAEIGRALAVNGPLYLGTTLATRFAITLVNAQNGAKVTRFSVCADKVAQCRTAVAQRLLQHFHHRASEPRVTSTRKQAGFATRIDASQKQRLARVDVSNADQGATVHEKCLYCLRPPA